MQQIKFDCVNLSMNSIRQIISFFFVKLNWTNKRKKCEKIKLKIIYIMFELVTTDIDGPVLIKWGTDGPWPEPDNCCCEICKFWLQLATEPDVGPPLPPIINEGDTFGIFPIDWFVMYLACTDSSDFSSSRRFKQAVFGFKFRSKNLIKIFQINLFINAKNSYL